MKNVHLLGSEDRPAPGDLRFLQGLLNTLDIDKGVDGLGTTSQTGEWLERFGLLEPGATVTDDDARRVRAFREAVRSLLTRHDANGDVDEAVRVLDDIAEGVPLAFSFDAQGAITLHRRAGGLDGAFGTLLLLIHGAATDGTWQRLKVCSRDSCRWVFYDSSKNQSSNWCSMQTCGNREKVARHRHRVSGLETD